MQYNRLLKVKLFCNDFNAPVVYINKFQWECHYLRVVMIVIIIWNSVYNNDF